MELKGTLDSSSLQEIFTTLARNKQIGTLIIDDGESKKYIYFARAGIRLLSSGKRKSVPLGDLLVQQNRITSDQLNTVLERQQETGEMMGKILSDWGLVTEEEIDQAVRSQIEEEIFDIFSWEDATFEFTEGAPPKELFDPNQRATRLTFDVLNLVQEANSRVQDMKEVKKLLPPLEDVYALGEFTELEYYEKDDSDPTKQIVMLIDGVRDIGEIISTVSLPKIDVARILGDLITQKKIEKVLRALMPSGGELDEGSDLESFIMKCEREIFNDPDNYTLRERLAQAYYDMGDLEKAVLHLNLVSKAQLKAGQLDKALATTKRVAEVVPEDPEVRERLLHIHLELRQIREALEEAAILARIYTEEQEVEKVRNMYKLVLELVPDDIDIRKKLINVHIDLGDRDAAAQEYEEIANIVKERGEHGKLEEIYLKILRLAPHRTDIKKRLNTVKVKPTIHIPRGRFAFGRRLIRWLLVLAVLGALGYVGYREYSAREKAAPEIEKSKKLEQEGDFEGAKKIIEKLKEANPYTVLAYMDLDSRLGEIEAAKKKAKEEVEEKLQLEVRRDYEALSHVLTRAEKILDDRTLTAAERYEKLKVVYEEMLAFSQRPRKNEWIDKGKAWIAGQDKKQADARKLLESAKSLESKGNIVEARKLRLTLRDKFAETEAAQDMRFPYRITSEPSQARVFVRGEFKGTSPLLLYEPLESEDQSLQIIVVKDGYLRSEETFWPDDVRTRHTFHFVLKRKPLWQIATGAQIQSAPVLDGNSLYFGGRDGFLYAIRTDTINPQDESTWFPAWKYKSPAMTQNLWEIIGTPIVQAGLVFYGSTDAHLYAVRNNRELWRFKAGGIVRFSPVLSGDMLLINCNISKKGNLYALQLEEGGGSAITRWLYPPKGKDIRKIVTAPTVYTDENVVFMGDTWGDVHIVDLQNGADLGSFNTKMSIETSFLLHDGTLFFVGSDRALHAYDVENIRKRPARELWTFPLPDAPAVPPVQFGGYVVVVTQEGHVIVLDVRKKGEILPPKWKAKVGGPVHALPRFSGTDLLIGSFDKNLYAIDWAEGKQHWRFETPGKIRGLVAKDGVIFCTCEEGIVFAINEK